MASRWHRAQQFFSKAPAEVDPFVRWRRESADAGLDGFGSFPFNRTLETIQKSEARGALDGVQLLTRFCASEQPYWHAFVEHYRRMNVSGIHVCVQTDEDRDWLLADAAEHGWSEIEVHRLDGSLTPDAALRTFSLAPLKDLATYTLLLDCDEYLSFQQGDGALRDLLERYPHAQQWHLPWLMQPMLNAEDWQRGGFWGHVGKPVVRSAAMQGVARDHLFELGPGETFGTIPLGMFGVVLVHFWARSFRDCLIKVFNNRFVDAKSADQGQALALIRQGELPVRLRLLAYFDLQLGYLPTGLQEAPQFDLALEEVLLRRVISEDDEKRAWELFCAYRDKLQVIQGQLPCYPAVTVGDLASCLPTLQS